MGTRIRFLDGTDHGLSTPSFSTHLSHGGNGHQRSEPGPASLNSGYGSTHRSIESGAPFGKGRGLFLRPVSLRNGCAHAVEALERSSTKRLLFLHPPQVMPALRGLIIELPV